jgi:hypothetical protein
MMGAVMRYRFTGQYTHGRTSLCLNGVEFEGRAPSEVPAELEWRFARHPEFEVIHPLDRDGDGHKGGSLPRRKRKAR